MSEEGTRFCIPSGFGFFKRLSSLGSMEDGMMGVPEGDDVHDETDRQAICR